MKVEVKLFAVAKQLAGCGVLTVDLPEDATVGDLRRRLAERVPELGAAMPGITFAVDAEYVSDATKLRAGADVACIPPVSGG